jgi:hypothetical protein
MKQILNASGENISMHIADEMMECYKKLSQVDYNDMFIKGELFAFTKVLDMLGRTGVLKVEIKDE